MSAMPSWVLTSRWMPGCARRKSPSKGSSHRLAALRGRFITAARDAERDFTVDWVHLKVSDGTLPTVALTDPFAHEDPRVDELVAALGR